MKKIISIALTVLLITTALCGCGEKYDRENYVKGLEKYVDLVDLENIVVDTQSEEYKEMETNILNSDFNSYTYEVQDGKIENGDIANINYAGKVDGVAFSGGTAENYDLEIGSGTFIEGFESQLIGVEVGKTVDVNVTFPSDYGDSTDLETQTKTITLSGAKAVFTVKVNNISRKFKEINDEFAKKAGFENAEKYKEDLKERTIKAFVYNELITKSTIKELPPDKEGNCYSYHKDYYTQYASSYSMTFADLLSENGMTEDQFKNEILKDEIISYAVFDALKLTVTKEAFNEKVNALATDNSATEAEVIEHYGKNFVEYILVYETIYDKLLEIAKVK
ncbi:MAG: hypothetical protein E7568_01030 [Ruminococcaceae bacterium]|nr:hypothetical protein [Oscillospiraceae bacterium]